MAGILIVDDEKNLRRSLRIAVEEWGYQSAEAASGEEALHLIEQDVYDVVLTDLVMEKMDGIELLKRIKALSPTSEVLMMSAYGTIEKAVDAMRQGAYDFIVKPFSMDYLDMMLRKVIGQKKLKQTVKRLMDALVEHYPFENVVAVSAGMREVMHQVALIAGWKVPVLIHGESGVGKELAAMAIHHSSGRSEGPFIPVNCGAFPDTLLDSELFGHCRGAFTGAVTNKRGLIEEADQGTLFLDEIGEAPAALQVRLLRFLDNGRFRRIGEVIERESDVRVIAATNQDLIQSIRDGRFREDLYYRLSVATIAIPPLRERKEDIPVLCRRFLEKAVERMGRASVRLHPQVHRLFQNYSWPGNVRELENTIEHSLIMTDSDEITVEDLPVKFRGAGGGFQDLLAQGETSLSEIERRYILSVLEKTGGNKKQAAEILKISRTTLISRLKSYSGNE